MSASEGAGTPVTPHGPHEKEHGVLFWAIIMVVVALTIVGLITYSAGRDNRDAQAKADQLVQRLDEAGFQTPEDTDQIVDALGDDGGAVCEDPGDALRTALRDQSLSNGASFVGMRPIIAPRRLVEAGLIVVQTYCPDELDALSDRVEDLELDDTVKP